MLTGAVYSFSGTALGVPDLAVTTEFRAARAASGLTFISDGEYRWELSTLINLSVGHPFALPSKVISHRRTADRCAGGKASGAREHWLGLR